MNWLEAILHYAPDGGDGSAETLLPLAIVLIVLRMVASRRKRTSDTAGGADTRT